MDEPNEEKQIPDRLFFRIGDVSDVTGVEAYVLRYWETEFTALKPRKGRNGQRQYRRKDVELVLEIKRLLYDQKFTIAGARKALRDKTNKAKRQERKPKKPPKQSGLFGPDPSENAEALGEIKKELREILALLK
ncbi:MAG: MerR family transcriptional regulator [Bryobacterales bacterium]